MLIAVYRKKMQDVDTLYSMIRPIKIHVFRATRPYLLEPANPRLFLRKYSFFFIGVFIIEVSILKKKQSRPYLKFLRPLPYTQDFFFGLMYIY